MTDDTESVIVMLTVPVEWKDLPQSEIARKLRGNEPHLTNMLAGEIKRWAGSGAVDLSALRQFLEDRGA